MRFKKNHMGKLFFKIVLTAIATVAAVLFALLSGSEAAMRIAVVITSAEPSFKEGLAGFQKYLEEENSTAEYEIVPLAYKASPAQREQFMEKIRQGGFRLVLTLGSAGAEAVAENAIDIPHVACMVLRQDNFARMPSSTGVWLEFPLEIQFSWTTRLFPEAKTIGVIYNPAENKQRIEAAKQIAYNRDLRLHAVPVHALQDIPAALQSVSKNSDVLWGLADRIALSPQIAQHVLLFAFQNGIPFIGPSPAWVKAGALYALEWDYRDMGAQCGEMAHQILNGTRPENIPPAPPRTVLYSINMNTAEHLKIELPEALIKKARKIY